MDYRGFVSLLLLLFALSSSFPQAFAEGQSSSIEVPFKVSTPFSTALDNLQIQINYTFKNIGLLRRAMTHASFSEENNKALSVLGASIIETSVALQALIKDVDILAKDLNLRIADASKVEGTCNAYGTRLALQRIVRVSQKTNVTAPSVVCGAFRAIFGGIAVDTGSSDEAEGIYEKVHSGIGTALTM